MAGRIRTGGFGHTRRLEGVRHPHTLTLTRNPANQPISQRAQARNERGSWSAGPVPGLTQVIDPRP
eukprot:87179-Rhodomonas_salina.3